jgi:hypothetical protein
MKKKPVVKNQKCKISEEKKTLEVSDKKNLKELETIAKGLNKKSYMYMQANPMAKLDEISKKTIGIVSKNLAEKLDNKEQIIDTIERIFKELIEGAYKDRMIAYTIISKGDYIDLEKVQSIRQRADNHLVKLMKAYTDFKKPPIKVSVRKLGQMNISDKQINISEKNTNDLDKK